VSSASCRDGPNQERGARHQAFHEPPEGRQAAWAGFAHWVPRARQAFERPAALSALRRGARQAGSACSKVAFPDALARPLAASLQVRALTDMPFHRAVSERDDRSVTVPSVLRAAAPPGVSERQAVALPAEALPVETAAEE
jgi:hypothetical protein